MDAELETELDATVLPDWKQWCRLCGNINLPESIHHISLEDKLPSNKFTLNDTIRKYFLIDMAEDISAKMICSECYTLSSSFVCFIERIRNVQTMFSLLNNSTLAINPASIKKLRKAFVSQDIKNSSIVQNLEKIVSFSADSMESCEDVRTPSNSDPVEETVWIEIKAADNFKEAVNMPEECELPIESEMDANEPFNDSEDSEPDVQNIIEITSEFESIGSDWECENRKATKYKAFDREFTATRSSTACPFCKKTFTTTHTLQTHITLVHLGKRPYICEKCGMAFKANGSLKEHMVSHTEERPFVCEVCRKGFKNKVQLKIHMDIHDVRKYICAQCGLQLNSRKTLNRHLLVHSDQMKYNCDYCGRCFKRGSTLKNHLIMHTGLKPYACSFCDRKFTFGSSCRAHKKRVHSQELADLEATGEGKVFTKNIPSLKQLKAYTQAKLTTGGDGLTEDAIKIPNTELNKFIQDYL